MVGPLALIQRALRDAATEDAAAASRKFVPSAVKVYGVRIPVINDLARKHKAGGLALSRALWRSGAFEERLLAAKLPGSLASQRSEPNARTHRRILGGNRGLGRLRHPRHAV